MSVERHYLGNTRFHEQYYMSILIDYNRRTTADICTFVSSKGSVLHIVLATPSVIRTHMSRPEKIRLAPNRWFVLLDKYLSVCLFVCGFSSHSRIFHSYRDVTITSECCRLWPMLGTYGLSLECHTYCDMDQPFIMVISEDTCHLLPSV